MSHYRIWQDVDKNSLGQVIVLEDDLRFTVNSTILLRELLDDVKNQGLSWDLIYLGRKRLGGTEEKWVNG